MVKTLTGRRLAKEFEGLWANDRKNKQRLRTLGRIAVHERQFENWWKFELATHLWTLAENLGVYVWVEKDARADILLAPANEGTAATSHAKPDLDGWLRVPIELKTVGTFWNNPKRAFEDGTKKSLRADMEAAVQRAAKPFAAVGLLITHVGTADDPLMKKFVDAAEDLAIRTGLSQQLAAPVSISERPMGKPVCAHQFLWLAR
ncbi:MAG: hypothetical protein IPM35_41325 [Myxococcales bacterium]|nr:hypothetical protein [Myxococcales bacterium]